ncbi:MAG: class I SAM-dependent methyltransferase [Actinomycetota bacterium]|nr:class I SAM-dependent methyltransferase [Actinomycetota bacterium]
MDDAASKWSRGFAAADAERMSVYDGVLVPSLFAPWAGVLLDVVKVGPGDRVLDVATGPGTVARPAASRAGSAGEVVACDISPAMLDVAARKPVQEGAAPISWVESPAAPLAGSLAAADGTFDVVTCQQGLQFFPDRPAALAEMRRMLRPGGRLGVAVWGHQSDSPGFAALGAALREVLGDEVADRFEGGPWGWPETTALAALLESAGFRHVQVLTRQLKVTFSDGPAQFVRSIEAGPAAADVAALPPERRAAFVTTAEELLAPMTIDGVLSFETVSNIGLATR